ncbi:MAG TPA: hypothetical protein DCL63_06540 [Firmicutes bacterium]|nr:hypothetical protein [Bacillota bacterium]
MTLVFLFGTCLCLTAFWIEDTGGVIRFTGIEYLPWWVERGGFDILLTKPVDTQFVLSLRRVNCEAVFGLAVGAVVVARSRQKNT